MPRTYTLVDARTRCLRRADKESSAGSGAPDSSFKVQEVNALISEQYGDLCGVVNGTGCRYFESSTDFTTTGVATISEPSDHLSTVDVIERVVDTTGHLRRVPRLAPQERWVWAGRTGHARRWEMVNRQIILYPTPPSGDVYRLRYIPQPPDLSTAADSTLIDVVVPDGEAFLIWGVAVKLLAKSQGASMEAIQLAKAERDEARLRLSEWASLRAFNDPNRTIPDDDDDAGGPYGDGDWRYDR